MQQLDGTQKYNILTYGCQMNVRDSETIAGLVEAMGYCETSTTEDADLIIFNTCSVRHSAENRVFGKLGEIRRLKLKNPEMLIAFGGCMAQIPDNQKRLKKQGVDIVFGTHNIHELPALIAKVKEQKARVMQVWEKEGQIVENIPNIRKPGLTAFVNIMYGCNNFCSYCIVPYTRGRERSRQPEDILTEIKRLGEQGYKEITLLGQNVNSYNSGGEKAYDFADLLCEAAEIESIQRIRFTTSHPKDISDKLIKTVAGHKKICKHIHMPLQAGSNEILRRMNRGYTREHYQSLTEKIRSAIPGAAITSDLIVGFPGETEQNFQQTLEMVEKVRFDAAFTFMYSVRKGTRAADFKDQLSLEEKKQRLSRLNELQYSIAADINRSLAGTVQEILVEGTSKTNPHRLTGRTDGNRIVIFSGPKELIGSFVHVRITRGTTFSLFGEIETN
ncbi:MAG TPA: tRNA (N6-isopentenyl adenosine(37)-C2)-methylthiotransferase MiaB [Syntrophomonadaceae bacterium]|nr:tRNA (N6-isopentenyl adenosine(37)-C2)-methylthiotransferase MiaB [Syntrophomonadaceae bacterium]HRX21062.1 tRNA (N6-isopentenyl adenosine(37)-C2)-methylthiotransferase MiaB [Syntrophomonadaceae bacterium]